MYDIKSRKSRQRIHSVFSETLEGANLSHENLQDADLRHANLRFADLTETRLEGADLTGANLDGARLAGAKYDAATIWPSGFNPKGSGAVLIGGAKEDTNPKLGAKEDTNPKMGSLVSGSSASIFQIGSRFEEGAPRPPRIRRADAASGGTPPPPRTPPPGQPALQPTEEDPPVSYDSGKDYWAPEILEPAEQPSAKAEPEPAAPPANMTWPPPHLAAAAEAAAAKAASTPPPPAPPSIAPSRAQYPPVSLYDPSPASASRSGLSRRILYTVIIALAALCIVVTGLALVAISRQGGPGSAAGAAAGVPETGSQPSGSPESAPSAPAAAPPAKNQPPVIDAAFVVPDSLEADGSLRIKIAATDPEGDAISGYYYWLDSQTDASMSASSEIKLAKPPKGAKKVYVTAEDSLRNHSAPFEVPLQPEPTETPKADAPTQAKPNRAPSLTASLAAEELEEGKSAILVAAAADPDGKDAKVEARIDGGAWLPVADGKLELSGLKLGERKIEARAIDGAGLASAVWTRTVRVRPAETPAPKFENYTETFGGLSIEMAWIPPGDFTMGSLPGEKGRDGDESPRHQVKLYGFWLGKYEITQKQYYDFITSWEKNSLARKPLKYKGSGKFPAQNLKWEDAYVFCQKLSEATGKSYVLPTESQWEYACRAGTDTPYYTGEEITSNQANFDERAMFSRKGVYRGQPVDVGCFKANKFGLHDMSGNVWEWCYDWYAADYALFAAGATNPKGPSGGRVHVIRGGGAHDGAAELRSANRRAGEADIKFGSHGFRIARIP